MLSPASGAFLNPKNLWIRLLAETGIVGSAVFVLFLLTVFYLGISYFRLNNRFGRFLGTFSMMSLAAILIESYTLDSFATAIMWIALGIISAPAWRELEPDREGVR